MFYSVGPSVIPLELDLCKINPEPFVFWGKFCQVWISGIESSEQEHFLSRIRDVDSAIASLNSLGFTIYKWQYPEFFLFDDQAVLSSQFRDFVQQQSYLQRLEGYLQDMDTEEYTAALPHPQLPTVFLLNMQRARSSIGKI